MYGYQYNGKGRGQIYSLHYCPVKAGKSVFEIVET